MGGGSREAGSAGYVKAKVLRFVSSLSVYMYRGDPLKKNIRFNTYLFYPSRALRLHLVCPPLFFLFSRPLLPEQIIAVSRSLGDARFKGRDNAGLARDLGLLSSKWRGGAGGPGDWAAGVAEVRFFPPFFVFFFS